MYSVCGWGVVCGAARRGTGEMWLHLRTCTYAYAVCVVRCMYVRLVLILAYLPPPAHAKMKMEIERGGKRI